MSIGVAMLGLAVWDRQNNLSSYPFLLIPLPHSKARTSHGIATLRGREGLAPNHTTRLTATRWQPAHRHQLVSVQNDQTIEPDIGSTPGILHTRKSVENHVTERGRNGTAACATYGTD